MKKLLALLYVGLAIACLIILIDMYKYSHLRAEKTAKAQVKTPKETQQKVQWDAMEKQLLIAKRGDLVRSEDERIIYVFNVNPENKTIILCWMGKSCDSGNYSYIYNAAKWITRVIHETDPDYPAAAVKFINQ